MTSPLELATEGMKEATLTIHQDAANPGRVLFSLDLSLDDAVDPDAVVQVPYCDLVALTLFNLAAQQAQAFGDTFLKVQACVAEIGAAQAAGSGPDEIAAIREKYGVQFRAA